MEFVSEISGILNDRCIVIIEIQVGEAADACGPTCETDSSVRFNLQNCNIILSKNFITEQTRFKMIEN